MWIYFETKDLGKIADLSKNIVWFVLPSLVFFVALPTLLKQGVNFHASLLSSTGITVLAYTLGG